MALCFAVCCRLDDGDLRRFLTLLLIAGDGASSFLPDAFGHRMGNFSLNLTCRFSFGLGASALRSCDECAQRGT